MIRPKDLSDCDCSPWQKLKQQIQALYEAVTQLGYKNTEQDGEIAGLDGRVSALEDAPPGSTAWGDITGDLDDQTDLKDALDLKADASAIPDTSNLLDDRSGTIRIANGELQFYAATEIEGSYVSGPGVDSTPGDNSDHLITSKAVYDALPDESDLVPSTSGASQGDVLSVGADGPEWVTPSGGGGSITQSGAMTSHLTFETYDWSPVYDSANQNIIGYTAFKAPNNSRPIIGAKMGLWSLNDPKWSTEEVEDDVKYRSVYNTAQDRWVLAVFKKTLPTNTVYFQIAQINITLV